MATAGVIVGSAAEAEDATSPAVETAADVLMLPIVDVARRQYAPAAVAVASMPQQRIVAYPMARPIPQPRVVALRMARPMPQPRVVALLMARPMPQPRVVALLTVAVADRTVVANTISPGLLNLSAGNKEAEHNSSAALHFRAVSHLKRVLWTPEPPSRRSTSVRSPRGFRRLGFSLRIRATGSCSSAP
jgi:hypothetical protein